MGNTPVDEAFACGICMEIMDNATEAKCCGHMNCMKCWVNMLKSGMTDCMYCRKAGVEGNLRPNIGINNMIEKIQWRCKVCSRGNTRADLKNHKCMVHCDHRDCKGKKFSIPDFKVHIITAHKYDLAKLFY